MYTYVHTYVMHRIVKTVSRTSWRTISSPTSSTTTTTTTTSSTTTTNTSNIPTVLIMILGHRGGLSRHCPVGGRRQRLRLGLSAERKGK